MVCTYGCCIMTISVYKLRFISVCVKRNFIWRRASFVPASHMKIEVCLRALHRPTKKAPRGCLSCWLGMLDSNQRMQESKSCALPLGEYPMFYDIFTKLYHTIRRVSIIIRESFARRSRGNGFFGEKY